MIEVCLNGIATCNAPRRMISTKTLYMIGGTMGVGKTTVCQQLKRDLPNSVFLDGDWCWDADPFQVTDETKRMVVCNIVDLLNRFLHCTAYENVIFCWVMHEQAIIDTILGRLDTRHCSVKRISLVCSEEALRTRLEGDIRRGLRTPDVIERSLARLPLYAALHTAHIDVSNLSVQEAAKQIAQLGEHTP